MPIDRRLFPIALLLSVLFAAVSASAQPITFSDWRETTPFEGPRVSHAALLTGNRLYVLGGLFSSGNDFTLYDDVQVATLANDGSIPTGSWRKTTPFSIARSGLGAVVRNGFVYVVAGFSKQGTLNDVQYAALAPDGTVGRWTQSPNRLGTPRSNHALEAFVTPSGAAYLAAIAGVGNIGQDTVHFDTIEVAPINQDGSVGAWKTCPFHLKGGRSAPGTAVSNGMLYVFGGWGDLLIEDVFSDVQYAPIRDDGCVDPWHTNPFALNMPLYGHTTALTLVTGSPVAIVLGGNAGQGNYFNNVQFAALAAAGGASRFTFDTHQFAMPRWGHASVRYGDLIYVIGGAQRGGYLRDVQLTSVKHE